MISKTGILGLSILFSILLIPITDSVFADHDHDEESGGGGCADCAPPTLGIDNAGTQHVQGGFAINGIAFDVVQWENVIEKQVVKTGETVEVTLKIYENGGPDRLSHVGLMLGLEEKHISGVWVQEHFAQINWDHSFDGVNTVEVVNPYDIIKNVEVESEIVDNLVVLTFRFIPIQSFDADTIVVKMWDDGRVAWTNHFKNAMEIETVESITTSGMTVIEEAETHDSETHDSETHGVETQEEMPEISEITCEDMYDEVVLRVADYSPVCVSAYEKSILIEYGWAIPIDGFTESI